MKNQTKSVKKTTIFSLNRQIRFPIFSGKLQYRLAPVCLPILLPAWKPSLQHDEAIVVSLDPTTIHHGNNEI